MQADLAKELRQAIEQYNNQIDNIELILRDCRRSNIEVELMDGINTEIDHQLDGLTGFKLKIVKITAKMPL